MEADMEEGKIESKESDVEIPTKSDSISPEKIEAESSPAQGEEEMSPTTTKLVDQAEKDGNPGIRQKFMDSKLARKQAEEDRKALLNRISLLKQEEEKAIKKIESTKKRAKEITEIKMRNAEILKQKEEWRRKKQEEEERQAAENKELRERTKAGIAMKQSQTLHEKRTKCQLIKSESEQAKEIISLALSEDIDKKHQKKSIIKDKEIALAQTKQRDIEEKKEKAVSLVEFRISHENEEKIRIEAEVSRLEQEEAELILRLQQTQMVQQSVAEDLDKALSSRPSINSSPAAKSSLPKPASRK